VDITWKNGKATRAVLHPRVDGVQVVRPPTGQRIAGAAPAADGTARIQMKAGREYVLAFNN
jgi:hypothetical protein